jgi:SET domain
MIQSFHSVCQQTQMLKMKTYRCLIASILCLHPNDVQSLSFSSSKSSKKDRVKRSNAGGGMGFGNNKPITLNHDICDDNNIQNLIHFLVKEQGAIINPGIEVGISKLSGIRGVFCTRPFRKGEILCQVPSDIALALSNPTTSNEEEMSLAQVGCNFLNMYVLDSHTNLVWKSYLDTLPSVDSPYFDATPDFYDSEELALLEFPRIIHLARQRRQDIQDVIEKNSDMSFEQLQHASWIVSSRSIAIPVSQGEERVDDMGRPMLTKRTKEIRVLVPFLDLVNHSSNSPNSQVHLIDPEKDNAWFALKAIRDIPAGKEILVSYGSGIQSSVEILSNYGFVPRDNKVDTFMLEKGGDDIFTSLDSWSTTMEEDEIMLEQTGKGRLRTILEFRQRLKQAIGEVKAK